MTDSDAPTERDSELLQVTLLSRHGVRAPLNEELSTLEPFVDLPWPHWNAAPAMLTDHGKRLVELLGGWYAAHYRARLEPPGSAPTDWIHAHADSLDRCVQTAERWLSGFLGEAGPEVPIKHQPVTHPTRYDPLFLPIESGKVEVQGLGDAVRGRLGGDLWTAIESLRGPLSAVQRALGGPVFSPEIYGDENSIGDDGSIRGTLQLAGFASDLFVLQHANGWPMEKVAWGRIDRTALLDIERARIFGDNLVARAPAYARGNCSNLLTQVLAGMHQTLSGERVDALAFGPATRLIGYFGHDTNIQTLGGLLHLSWIASGFVQDQAPPACAHVFELHCDRSSGEPFVRLWFITATLEQMFRATELTKHTPPSLSPLGLAHRSELRTSLDVPFDEFDRIARAAIEPTAISPELAVWLGDGATGWPEASEST